MEFRLRISSTDNSEFMSSFLFFCFLLQWNFSAQPVSFDIFTVTVEKCGCGRYLILLNRKLETSPCCDDSNLHDLLLSVVFTAD